MMKRAYEYWRATIFYRSVNGARRAVKLAAARDKQEAMRIALSACRMAVRENVIMISVTRIPRAEAIC